MGREERKELIKKIEELRKSRMLIYFCGDRPIVSAQIHDDAIRPMYEHLKNLGEFLEKPRKLDLYLYSRGGLMETPWKIITMLREFCDELHVIIPYKAYSAATMIAIGADKIWMTDKSELSPIDPALQLQKVPERPDFLLPEIGVEDVASYITFIRQRAGLTDQAALAGVVETLAKYLTPPLLGRIERTYNHIRLVARKLLALCKPPMEDTRVTAIVEALTEKTFVHGHGIGRKEAKQIGLQVEDLNDEPAKLAWALFQEYEKTLKLNTSADPCACFSETAPDFYIEQDTQTACIESNELFHAFVGNLRLQRIRRIPPQPIININLAVNLPANLKPEQLPKEVQQAIQQFLQGIAQQLKPMVEQEIAKQSPIQGFEGRLEGGQWKQMA